MWKTDQNVILGLFHFTSLANIRNTTLICTLLIHSGITRLSWLVCYTGTSFANYLKSQLRQYGQWRAPNGRQGSEIDTSGSETSHKPSKHVWAYGWHLLDSWLLQTVLTEGITRFQLPTLTNPTPLYIPLTIL